MKPSKQLAELLAGCLNLPVSEYPAFVDFARGVTHNPVFDPAPSAPPPQSAQSAFHAPAPITSLVGRAREVQAAVRLLRQPSKRLLTLHGPPGVGKTRLSLAIASALQSEFTHGVYFVPLAPISDMNMVLPAIVAVLRVRESPGESMLETAQAWLHDKRLLLVLDNFEQVMGAAGVVQQLLADAPGVKALVSSRELLKLYGEVGFSVGPLEVPAVADTLRAQPSNALAQYPAVDLFVQRARAKTPDFTLTDTNVTDVVRICAALDGLPLAIEMAAAQVKSSGVSLPQLHTQLTTRLTELSGGMRGLTPRQQTLRGAINWSFQLLSPTDRALFARLAVFAGGFTPEAAGEVIGQWLLAMRDSSNEGIAPTDGANTARMRKAIAPSDHPVFSDFQSPIAHFESPVTAALESLNDKSLLRHEQGTDGNDAHDASRFSMFETIREFALEKLAQSGEIADAQRHHAGYYAQLARRAEPHLSGPQQEQWLARLDADLNNLRTALDYCAEHAVGVGLQMATALWQFFHARGYLSEGRARIERLIQRCDDSIPPLVRAWALRANAALCQQQGDTARATHLATESLTLFRAIGLKDGIAALLHLLGNVALMQSNYAAATANYEEALAQYRETGNRLAMATVLTNLGLITKDQGNYRHAMALYEEARDLHSQLGNKRGIANTFIHSSIAAYWQGDYVTAGTLAEQALDLQRESGNRLDQAYGMENLGMVLFKQGAYARAWDMLNESLVSLRELGDKSGIALLNTDLGCLAHAQGHDEQSRDWHLQGLRLSMEVGDKRRAAFCLEGLAAAFAEEQPERATRLFSAAARLREDIGAPLPPSEQQDYNTALQQLHTRLDDGTNRFESATAAGRSMTLDQTASII